MPRFTPRSRSRSRITGQQARILQGQISDQRRGLALPGISASASTAMPWLASARKTSTSTSPIIASASPWNCGRAPPHLRAGDRQHLRGLVHHTRNDAIRPVSPAPPAPQLGPQHQPTAYPRFSHPPAIPELEHMCTAVRAGSTAASRPESAG